MSVFDKSRITTADVAENIATDLLIFTHNDQQVPSKIIRGQTSTGSEQITLDLGGRDRFHITITRARS